MIEVKNAFIIINLGCLFDHFSSRVEHLCIYYLYKAHAVYQAHDQPHYFQFHGNCAKAHFLMDYRGQAREERECLLAASRLLKV